MNDPSPYQPPSTASVPPPMGPAGPEPGVIKVFAIIHLVFAGLGVLAGIWAMVASFVLKAFFGRMAEQVASDAPEAAESFNRQIAIMDSSNWMNVLGGVFSLVLAAMLFVAGMGLLKRRIEGLTWSNRYAWSSIAFKLVNLVLTVVYLPRMMAGMMPGELGSDAEATGMMVGGIVGGVIGGLVSMAYPILCLVLLNREPVRQFLEARSAAAAPVAG